MRSELFLRCPFALVLACICLAISPETAVSQDAGWNDPPTMDLVDRAVALRQRQVGDSGLRDFRAQAHGYLTFLAQMGEGFVEAPRAVKVDQLATEVLWRAPDFSKQRLIGQRDTLLLPARVNYYRDRFGVVLNNLPDVIRMGDAQDVRDVPHPLSPAGRSEYDYAVRDSLSFRFATGRLDVYEVQVRPHDTSLQRFVGNVYLERETGAVVRMAFTFTQAAMLDKRIEQLNVLLENSLIEGRYWLPSRQELEVVRQAQWLDFPVRGIIRARWDICCYELNTQIDERRFRGAPIVSVPREQLDEYPFVGDILEELPPDVLVTTDEDVERIREGVQELVRAQALSRPAGGVLSARRISDFARFNRVEGLALGLGGAVRLSGGITARLGGRFGIADEQLKARVALVREPIGRIGITLYGERIYRLIGDLEERSLAVNSLAAGFAGRDYTNPYDVSRAGATFDFELSPRTRLRVDASYEFQDPLTVNTTSLSGTFQPTTPAWSVRVGRLAITLRQPSLFALGGAFAWTAELRGGLFTGRDTTIEGSQPVFARLSAGVDGTWQLGAHRVISATSAAGVVARPDIPPQEYVFYGGPWSAPGYDYHSLTGEFGISQRVEWQFPVPFFAIPLGQYGRTPASATIAPYAQVAYTTNPALFAEQRTGFFPSVGLGVNLFFDVLRLDLAKGLRDGGWIFNIDVMKQLWSIL